MHCYQTTVFLISLIKSYAIHNNNKKSYNFKLARKGWNKFVLICRIQYNFKYMIITGQMHENSRSCILSCCWVGCMLNWVFLMQVLTHKVGESGTHHTDTSFIVFHPFATHTADNSPSLMMGTSWWFLRKLGQSRHFLKLYFQLDCSPACKPDQSYQVQLEAA